MLRLLIVFKKMKPVFKYLSALIVIIFAFLYGLYIGTVNNNYIHDKKRLLLNSKTIAINYFKQINTNINKLHIKTSNKSSKVLQTQKQKFSEQRIINKDSAEWLKAKIIINEKEDFGKLKLKGMFLDGFEWKEKHFSYSVKVNKATLQGLSKFYLHYPDKRMKLYEWYGDKLLESQKLIYHRNFFVDLMINNYNNEIYLVEEKSNKKLLKNNKRDVGPIIYFSKEHLRNNNYDFKESYNNAKIKFQYPHSQNLRAKELLNGYRYGEMNPEQVFNIEKTGTLFALSELIGYVHHLQFHNIKFYYNPKEDRLEPIANDFQFSNLEKWTPELLFTECLKRNDKDIKIPWANRLYQDQKFQNSVIKELKRLSSKGFLKSFFKNIREEENIAKLIISKFDPLFVPDVAEIMFKNSQQINYILKNPTDLEMSISIPDRVLTYKTKNYLPIIPLSIYKDSTLVYTFKEKKLLKANNFGNLPNWDTIHLKSIKLTGLETTLIFNYKITGDSTELHHPIQITD
jgi:hypothetical protein